MAANLPPQPDEEGEEGGPTPQPEEGGEGPGEGGEGPFPGEGGEGEQINACGETISEWGSCIAAPHCCSDGLKCFQRSAGSARCAKACEGEACREFGSSEPPVSGGELGEKAPVCGNCESGKKGGVYCTSRGKGAKNTCSAIPKSGTCPAGKTKCFGSASEASRARKLVRLVLRRGIDSFAKTQFGNMLQGLFNPEVQISFKFICPSSACPQGSCGGASVGDSSTCLKLDGTDSRRAAALENDGKEEGSVVAFEIEGGSAVGLVRAFNKKQLPGVVAMHEEWEMQRGAADDDETAVEEEKSKKEDESSKGFLPILITAVSVVAGCVLVAVATVFYRRSKAADDFAASHQGIDMTSLTTMSHPAVNNEEKKDFVSELRI